jgi:hypothetical protein
MTIDAEKMEHDFQIYVTGLKDNLSDLEYVLKDAYGPDYHLDFTFESLDAVERFLAHQLDHYTIKIFPIGKLLENISTYMGETAIKKLNGHWDLERNPKDFDFGYPMVVHLDGLPKDFGWCPIQVVFNFKRHREFGMLKKAAQSLILTG